MRYNFHNELKKVKTDPKYVLPLDINKPVTDFLNEIGCKPGSDKVKLFQEKIRYGKIDLIHDDKPTAKLSIQIDCGMADGYKKCEVDKIGKWTIVSTFGVRNSCLDKKKPERCKNG